MIALVLGEPEEAFLEMVVPPVPEGDGPKPQQVADLGATYHADTVASLAGMADVVIE